MTPVIELLSCVRSYGESSAKSPRGPARQIFVSDVDLGNQGLSVEPNLHEPRESHSGFFSLIFGWGFIASEANHGKHRDKP